jgi:hypothetical protein
MASERNGAEMIGTQIRGIRIKGVDIELDRDGDLCFDLDRETSFFHFDNDQAIQLRDYLNEKLPASSDAARAAREGKS